MLERLEARCLLSLPSLSVNDVTVTEGNTGTTSAVFNVSLSESSMQNVSVQYSTANNTATAPSDYATTTGMLSFMPGQTLKTISVTIAGDTLRESDETFYVNLISPMNATILDGQGVGTITNDDPKPTLSINDVTVTEGNSGTVTASFTVSLSTASGQTVTVQYATGDDTATAPSDYTAASGTMSFGPGETSKTLAVSVTGDSLNEATESFYVNLSNPTNAAIVDGQGIGTISNDDPMPAISITDASVTEGNSGTLAISFAISLPGASSEVVSVQYNTEDGTAGAPDDYTPASGTLTFAAGETTKSLLVLVNGDTVYEPDETFSVTLSNPVNATILDGQAIGMITNDDHLPSISISDATVTEGDAGTMTATTTVRLSGPSSQTVSVQYSTSAGTASDTDGFTPAAGTFIFAPGEMEKTVAVSVIGDSTDEPDESLTVELSDATNATISDGVAVVTILDDDAPPTLSVDYVAVVEPNEGATNAVFTVSLSQPSSQTVTVQYHTVRGTAAAGADYSATAGTLTFAPGVTSQFVSIDVAGDTLYEHDETFVLELSAPSNATIADGRGAATIMNDDPMPSLSIGDVTVAEGNWGTSGVFFTVSLAASSGLAITVEYATRSGTATASSDYTPSPFNM